MEKAVSFNYTPSLHPCRLPYLPDNLWTVGLKFPKIHQLDLEREYQCIKYIAFHSQNLAWWFFLFFYFVALSISNNYFWSQFPSAIPYANVIDSLMQKFANNNFNLNSFNRLPIICSQTKVPFICTVVPFTFKDPKGHNAHLSNISHNWSEKF